MRSLVALVVAVTAVFAAPGTAAAWDLAVGGKCVNTNASTIVARGTEASVYVYDQSCVGDLGEHVCSIYALTGQLEGVEVGWVWDKISPSWPDPVAFVWEKFGGVGVGHTLYSVTFTPGYWPTFRLDRYGNDDWAAFVNGQWLYDWPNTTMTSAHPIVGAERAFPDDDNRGSFKNVKYRHLNTGEWYWWPRAIEYWDRDRDFKFFDRASVNHWVYVDRG